jgi:hypothetical protein
MFLSMFFFSMFFVMLFSRFSVMFFSIFCYVFSDVLLACYVLSDVLFHVVAMESNREVFEHTP